MVSIRLLFNALITIQSYYSCHFRIVSCHVYNEREVGINQSMYLISWLNCFSWQVVRSSLHSWIWPLIIEIAMQQSQGSTRSSNPRSKPPLEEKFVHLYKEIFSGCSLINSRKDSGIQGQAALTRFWDELLLLKVSGFIFSLIMPVMVERIIYLLILALFVGLWIYHKYPSVRWCSI